MASIFIKIYRFIFARKCFFYFNKFIYRCSLSGLGILNYENDRVSGERNFLKSYFQGKKGGLVIDVGANVGSYSRLVFDINPVASIIAFEPHPKTFVQLCRNVGELGVVVNNLAVGEFDGVLVLYDYDEKDGSAHASLYKDVIENIHGSKSVSHEVGVICLDDFCKEKDVSHVSLLKIDTEGHEMAVLKGAKNLIDSCSIDAIHFEFNEMNISSRSFFRDFWNILDNYDIYRLLPDGMVRMKKYSPLYLEIFAYQNIVAILKKNTGSY